MEKIDTDYKQQNWKVKLNPFNRDVAFLKDVQFWPECLGAMLE